MVTITNQMLYNALKAEFSKNGVTDVTAEEAYSYFTESLTGQEGFSEELVEKCASVAFDAANDCYSELCGAPSQNTYSDENLEDLFTAESEQEFYSWVGSIAKGAGAAVKQGYKNFQRKYKKEGGLAVLKTGASLGLNNLRGTGSAFKKAYRANRTEDAIQRRSGGDKEKADKMRKRLAYSRMSPEEKAAHNANLAAKAKAEAKEARATKRRENKSFITRFKDDKGSFMGMGKKGTGLKTWAKQNKAQAATAAAVGTAAVAGGAYLTYKAIKKRKAAKQAQQNQNQTQNQAANA
jgi:hypothetical protein